MVRESRALCAFLLSILVVSSGATCVAQEIAAFNNERYNLPALASAQTLQSILDHPDATWIVARVSPRPNEALSEETAPNRPFLTRYGGACALVAIVSGKADTQVDHYLAQRTEGRWIDSRTPPDPLWSGQDVTVIGRVDHIDGKTVTFGEVSVIPRDWGKQVKPAVEYLRTHRSLLKNVPKEDGTDLATLLKGDNSFLAVAAFRTLVAKTPVDPTLAYAFTSQDPTTKSVYSYLLLETGATKSPEAIGELFAQEIHMAKTAQSLRPIGLGAAIVAREWGNSGPGPVALAVLQTIRNHPATGSGAATDPYLSALFGWVEKYVKLPSNIKGLDKQHD